MTVDGAKLDAVRRVVEHLEQQAIAVGVDRAAVNAAEIARELRGILEFQGTMPTAFDRAASELAWWARRHSVSVRADQLVGALLSEATLSHLDAGYSREAYLTSCEQVWDAVSLAQADMREATEGAAATACADPGCSACACAGEADAAAPGGGEA